MRGFTQQAAFQAPSEKELWDKVVLALAPSGLLRLQNGEVFSFHEDVAAFADQMILAYRQRCGNRTTW